MPFTRLTGGQTGVRRRTNTRDVLSDARVLNGCPPLPRQPLDRMRAEPAASVDCTERVAAVLQKLGYGFATIPRGASGPRHH